MSVAAQGGSQRCARIRGTVVATDRLNILHQISEFVHAPDPILSSRCSQSKPLIISARPRGPTYSSNPGSPFDLMLDAASSPTELFGVVGTRL